MKRIGYISMLFLSFIGVVLSLFFFSKQEKQKLINNQFSGVITEININAKKTPLVKLNTSDIKINFAHFDVSTLENLEIGDSLFKNKNSKKLEHYKKIQGTNVFKYKKTYYVQD